MPRGAVADIRVFFLANCKQHACLGTVTHNTGPVLFCQQSAPGLCVPLQSFSG